MAASSSRPAPSGAPRVPHQLFENKVQERKRQGKEAGVTVLPEQVWERGIVIGDWTVRVTHGSIANASDMDALSDKLDIPLPEMPFLHNALALEHAPSGFTYCFDATRALQCVDGVRTEQQRTPMKCELPTHARPHRSLSRSGIQVAYAKEWGQSRRAALAAHGGPSTPLTSTKQYDWTYSSTWPGMAGAAASVDLHDRWLPVSSTPWNDAFQLGMDPANDRIPVERLGAAHGEQILFYDDIVLYEDELGDNGSSMLTVKVRVMPTSLLVLQRFFLRVDQVVFRLFDTRLFVSFLPSGSPSCRTRT
ncbi:Tap42 interacting protein [Malassezia equina]|uniref:Tap42 interacting protein n=1 Tax=Malassezia equina TaxID=1381935 RepID=A0AAF0EC00_9BASI|nr:Tap42 interacting protein [Malassezia equina]